ncbi:MAG: hypothetical protein ABIR58_01430 [Gemmatimonadaceae bacterium]
MTWQGFHVRDGYANTRVAKFSSTGQLQFQWGEKGSAPGQFDLPHGIGVDGEGRVFVADRLARNGTIEAVSGRFDKYDGQFRLGHDITVSQDGAVYIVDAWALAAVSARLFDAGNTAVLD